ncbi:MAG: phosphatase PAP2 family protein [bacterium]|nr:phosphatase PAP2 family protein [bacterium]
MTKIKLSISQAIGIFGTAACLVILVARPSFPTPDKIVIFLFFAFMIFNQAKSMLKRLLPFVVLLLVYESFRSIADKLNSHVDYTFAPHIDNLLFGNLPTTYLQNWLWHGYVRWYDFVLYIPYLLFFIVPIGLALLVWKTRDSHYWNVVSTYLVLFFSGFLTYLIFPAAPPWLASDGHYIAHITRISSEVWYSLGIRDFPSLYSQIAPNPVAAVPSLHAACATLFSIFIFKLYGKKWGALSLLYPISIYFGVVYEGEHYAFDVILGISYAVAAYLLTPYLMRAGRRAGKLIISRLHPPAPKAVQ